VVDNRKLGAYPLVERIDRNRANERGETKLKNKPKKCRQTGSWCFFLLCCYGCVCTCVCVSRTPRTQGKSNRAEECVRGGEKWNEDNSKFPPSFGRKAKPGWVRKVNPAAISPGRDTIGGRKIEKIKHHTEVRKDSSCRVFHRGLTERFTWSGGGGDGEVAEAEMKANLGCMQDFCMCLPSKLPTRPNQFNPARGRGRCPAMEWE